MGAAGPRGERAVRVGTHVVVLGSGDPLPVARIGAPIAKAVHRALADVSRTLRLTRGIIDLDLGEIDAEIVASILERQGMGARICARDELPEPAPPHHLLDADPGEEGLLLQNVDLESVSSLVPWSRLRFSAAGTVELPPTPRPGPEGVKPGAGEAGSVGRALGSALSSFAGSGLFGALGMTAWAVESGPPPRPPKPGETVHCLDLVLREPDERYRVVSGRFVYDYLGEKMALTSRQNFRTLILDIARLAPDALLTGTTQSFLTNPKARAHKFQTPEEFDAYVRWALAWSIVWSES